MVERRRSDASHEGALRPLGGIRVLDLTRILAGPYCTLLLADLGADVLKIERPEIGDDTRHWGPPFIGGGMASYFAAINRDKRSLVIDLRTKEGLAIFRDLASRSDVIVENFRPGVTSRLGIDYEALRAVNEGLIYCSITAFGPGEDGVSGTEVIVEALSGLMASTGLDGGPPIRFGAAMIDIATGLAAVAAILGALMERHESQHGRLVECSLYSTALSSMTTILAEYLASGNEPKRYGSGHASIVPYAAFPTMDSWVVIGALNDDAWRHLCKSLGLEALGARLDLASNSARVAKRQEIEAGISRVTGTWFTDALVSHLRADGLLVGPVRTTKEVLEHGLASGEIQTYGAEVPVPAVYLPFVRPPRAASQAPQLGEHSLEVLREVLNLDEASIRQFVKTGIVGEAATGLSSREAEANP